MLEYFEQLVPLLDACTFHKGSIGLYDREKYLLVTHGSKVSIPLQTGDRLAPGSSSYRVIESGKPFVAEIGAEVLGIPYFAAAYPIVVNGEIIGGMVVAVPMEMNHISEDLQDTSQALSASLQQISAAIQSIAAAAQVMATGGQTVSESSREVREKAEATVKVVHYIDSVATNTKLLGINASIEAARAGESGRGFGVVANEIQKMAISSAGSAQEIRNIMGGIRDKIGDMVDELSRFTGHAQEVTASIEEISASLSSLVSITERVKELAAKL